MNSMKTKCFVNYCNRNSYTPIQELQVDKICQGSLIMQIMLYIYANSVLSRVKLCLKDEGRKIDASDSGYMDVEIGITNWRKNKGSHNEKVTEAYWLWRKSAVLVEKLQKKILGKSRQPPLRFCLVLLSTDEMKIVGKGWIIWTPPSPRDWRSGYTLYCRNFAGVPQQSPAESRVDPFMGMFTSRAREVSSCHRSNSTSISRMLA